MDPWRPLLGLHWFNVFGSLAEVHDNLTVTNRTRTMQTTPALCLGSTGNQRGTYRFFSLETGHPMFRA